MTEQVDSSDDKMTGRQQDDSSDDRTRWQFRWQDDSSDDKTTV